MFLIFAIDAKKAHPSLHSGITDCTAEISPDKTEGLPGPAGFLGAKPQTGIVRGCPMQILSYFWILSILSGKKPGFLKKF
jgi:hypothetical protein